MTKIVSELPTKVGDAIMSHDSYNEKWKMEVLENNKLITLMGTVPHK